jgi:hypothetical protein
MAKDNPVGLRGRSLLIAGAIAALLAALPCGWT